MTDGEWFWESERFDWEAVNGKFDMPQELMSGLRWQGFFTFGGANATRFWARSIERGETSIWLNGVVIDASDQQFRRDKGGREQRYVRAKRAYHSTIALHRAGVASWPYTANGAEQDEG